jgi:hypothetical protein
MNQHLHMVTLGVKDLKRPVEVLYGNLGLETVCGKQ